MTIYNDRKTRYMFERYDQKLVGFTFKAIFMSYCTHFSGSKAIYMFESYDQKLVVFAFYGHFHDLLPTVLSFQGVHKAVRPDTCLRYMTQKLVVFTFKAIFMSYRAHFS